MAAPDPGSRSIPLGSAADLAILFAYPNVPGGKDDLASTIQHWLRQTICRDGLDQTQATVTAKGNQYALELPAVTEEQFQAYADRIGKVLAIGKQAYEGPIAQIQSRSIWCTDGKIRPLWDPQATNNWRFFLTLGVGYLNHRTLQFFHYPPSRLLNPLRDSMKDPVTYRCRDLLVANGVAKEDTRYYETRINSTPIAAPDDQGTAPNDPAADPVVGGLIPIGYFRDFERQMLQALLKPHPTAEGFTIPLTAYGKEPRQQLGGEFLDPDKAMVMEILPGLHTPVLGSNHPYRFYAEAQGGSTVGSGSMLTTPDDQGKNRLTVCTALQQDDLAVVRWQVQMAQDPSQDPWAVIQKAQEYWREPGQQDLVAALVRRHASLKYDDPNGYKFRFQLDWDGKPLRPDAPDDSPC